MRSEFVRTKSFISGEAWPRQFQSEKFSDYSTGDQYSRNATSYSKTFMATCNQKAMTSNFLISEVSSSRIPNTMSGTFRKKDTTRDQAMVKITEYYQGKKVLSGMQIPMEIMQIKSFAMPLRKSNLSRAKIV